MFEARDRGDEIGEDWQWTRPRMKAQVKEEAQDDSADTLRWLNKRRRTNKIEDVTIGRFGLSH